MPNGINTLSPTFRDALLNRNIIADTITNNGLTSELAGIGYPVDPVTLPLSVQPSPDITVDGVYYKDGNIILNKYQGDVNDYAQYNVTYLPGNTNSTIAGNPWNNQPYSIDGSAAELLQANESNLQSNVIKNQYLDVTKLTPVEIVYKQAITQTGSYLDENNNLNIGGPSTQPLDIIGSITQGGGIGFDPNSGGLVSDFDVRSSLAGRILTAGGVINDTRLGQLAAGYLATAIGNNIAFELQENTLGRINLNPISLAKGNSLIVPNYKITVGQGILGKTGDLLERMSGAKLPFSLLGNESSIFSAESGVETGNIGRANNMISNTGKGQVLQMFANMNANIDPKFIGKRQGFIPAFKDDRTERGFNQAPISGGSVYAYASRLNNGGNLESVNDIPEDFDGDALLSAKRYQYLDSKEGFSWGDEFNNNDARLDDIGIVDSGTNFKNKNSLLFKTQELFNSNTMKTLVSGHGVQGQVDSQTQNTVRGYMSKGSGVLSADALSSSGNLPARNTFCRTWTTFDRYDNIQDLQKHSGLYGGPNYPNRPNDNLTKSVLESTGFVKIGPSMDEEGNIDDIKRFMFSIENLAWADDLSNLLECEKGPGDPLSGLRGRIMWFPPYDISFNESTSVNWDKTNFIGRGEPIYTYNNTERTGTLSWKVIIDHPNYANFFPNNWGNDEISSFFAGCLEYDDVKNLVLTQSEKDAVELKDNTKKVEKVDTQQPDPVTFKVYFPNDVAVLNSNYESGLSGSTTADVINYKTNPTGEGFGIKTYKGGPSVNGTFTDRNYTDNTNFGLNGLNSPFKVGDKAILGYLDSDFVYVLDEYLKNECKYCKIYLKGYASLQGSVGDIRQQNIKLSENRANAVKNYLQQNVLVGDNLGERRFAKIDGEGEVINSCTNTTAGDAKVCKEARYVEVRIVYDASLKETELLDSQYENPNTNPFSDVSVGLSRFFTECHYFKRLREEDNFVYDNIREKIRYFHPSFHSMTPEGFNSRLNFLHQCTRQGPTKNNDGNPDNLAFGRPPVCILRIGDFYHTKIVIDSMSLDFDPLVWDLNPEGVGVQPMIANVTINFSFIGGSSLEGPINKLQNAVSYNFFANTEIYDARADRIKIKQGLQANDEAKGYGELVPGEKVNSPVVPLEVPENKTGLNNNTNDSTNNQEVEANNEANKPEVAQEPEESADTKILKNILLKAYTNDDDNHHITIVSDSLISLGEGWNYNVGTYSNNQFVKLSTKPINVDEDLNENGDRLDIDTTLSRGDGIRIAWDYDTGSSLAYWTQRENTAEVAACYSTKTDTNMTIPAISFGVEFWKKGEETIRWSTRGYIYECVDDTNGKPIYSIAPNEYMATTNKARCLRC